MYLTFPFLEVIKEEEVEVDGEEDSQGFLYMEEIIMWLTTNLVVYLKELVKVK